MCTYVGTSYSLSLQVSVCLCICVYEFMYVCLCVHMSLSGFMHRSGQSWDRNCRSVVSNVKYSDVREAGQ